MTRVFVCLSLFLGLLGPWLAEGQGAPESQVRWISERVKLDQEIQIRPLGPSHLERLQLPGGESLDLPTRLPRDPSVKNFDALPAGEQEAYHQTRRDILLAAARMLSAKRLSSLSVVGQEDAVHLVPEKTSLEANSLTPLDPLAQALNTDEGRASNGKVKKFLSFLNEAIILSTYRAAKDNWANRAALRGKTNEFGIQITLKAEFQLGIGRYNILKNLPLVIGFGYRKDTREVIIRAGRRQEVMSGGSAISAGVKIELRQYRRISGPESRGAIQVEGISWYPPALPALSLVADSSPIYRSTGLVFGLNLADLIPGLYFVNTVNSFTDKEVFVRALRLPAMLPWIRQSTERLKQWRALPPPVPLVACRAVFQG